MPLLNATDEEIERLVKECNLPRSIPGDIRTIQQFGKSASDATRACEVPLAMNDAQMAAFIAGTIAGLVSPIADGTVNTSDQNRKVASRIRAEMKNYSTYYLSEMSEHADSKCTCREKSGYPLYEIRKYV